MPHENGGGLAHADDVVALARQPARDIAAAILVAEDGRYLMQLRDAKPVNLPEHWTLFGGGIDPGETPEAGLRRELGEELCWTAREAALLMTSVVAVGEAGAVWRLHFFVVPFRAQELATMTQMEGADMALMPLDAICRLERVAPWDLAAIIVHARRHALFSGRGGT